jgi:hypothetical protein
MEMTQEERKKAAKDILLLGKVSTGREEIPREELIALLVEVCLNQQAELNAFYNLLENKEPKRVILGPSEDNPPRGLERHKIDPCVGHAFQD